MYGIFNKATGKLDCDPEPMVFDIYEDAHNILHNFKVYDNIDEWYVRELTDEEKQKVKEAE